MKLSDTFIESWQRNQQEKPRRNRRKYIKLAIILTCCILFIFLLFFFLTDLLSRNNPELEVKSNPGEWAMYGRDNSHSAIEKMGNTIPEGIVTKIFTAQAPMRSSPVYAGGNIYVGSRDSHMYAIQESSGQLLWSFKTGSWVESSAAVVNNRIYFGSNDGGLYALDAQTGNKVWSYHVQYPIKSSPAVVDDRIYFGGNDFKVYCLNTKNGKKIWSKLTNNTIDSSPAISNGILYIGSTDGNLYALNAANGKQRFRLPTSKIIVSSPVVANDTGYFITSEAAVYAVNGLDRNWFGEFMLRPPWMVLHVYGDLPAPPPPSGYLWSLFSSRGEYSSSSPSLNGENLYAGLGQKVVSINTVARDKQWETPVGTTIYYAGVLSQNTVYATGDNGHLYILNQSNGQLIKDIPVGGALHSIPLMVDGKIYLSSEDGNLYQVK